MPKIKYKKKEPRAKTKNKGKLRAMLFGREFPNWKP